MKFKDFEDLQKGLKDLPMTWYPQLLADIVEAAYAKNVYLNGGASRHIANLEKRIGKDKNKEGKDHE